MLELGISQFGGAIKFFTAYVALVNPVYGIPVFLGMTSDFSGAERRRTAMIVAVTIFLTGAVSLLIGEEVLHFLGIDIPSLQIAGGIIVLGIGLAMVGADAPPSGPAAPAGAAEERKNIAIVPLAIPLTIGPGAIATIIMFAHRYDPVQEVTLLGPVVLIVALLIWLGLRFAEPISHRLGDTVLNVISRVMGIMLAAVAVEMISIGVAAVVVKHIPGMS